MLNKIKLVGKIILANKEGLRKEISPEKKSVFFSVLVSNPLRCVARDQVIEKLELFQTDDLVGVKGYFRNEKESAITW